MEKQKGIFYAVGVGPGDPELLTRQACRILTQHGFACRNFSGGYRFYRTVVQERAAAEHALPCGMET